MVPKPRVKASDVAAAAGVSVATVSYVLNDTPGQRISPTTAERVREAAKKLGYVRNRTAQSLARGDSRIVVIDLSGLPSGRATEEGIHQFNTRIEALGYTPVQSWWRHEQSSHQLPGLVRNLGATRVLSDLPLPEEVRIELRELGVRTISSLVSANADEHGAFENSTTTQVQHLANAGHTHLLYTAGCAPSNSPLHALHQAAGSRAAAQIGLRWHVVAGASSFEEHNQQIAKALKQYPQTSAIVGFNDQAALQALTAVATLGLRVPDDIAVIGSGNSGFSAYTNPPLTTVSYAYDLSLLPEGVFDFMLEGTGSNGISRYFGEAITTNVIRRSSA